MKGKRVEGKSGILVQAGGSDGGDKGLSGS
jgi:hypothetical protein